MLTPVELPSGAEEWLNRFVQPTGEIEPTHVRPWATVWRVPLRDGLVWFKACAPVQAFEPHLTAMLSRRWSDRVGEVLAFDVERAWLILADAGTRGMELGNPPELWLKALPLYAELQRGEAQHAADHLVHGVPDVRMSVLPRLYALLLERDLPIEPPDVRRLRAFEARLGELTSELCARAIPETIQHDDLHMTNVYVKDGRTRILDWGDASISHPFASLVVTFRFLEEINGFAPGDPWFERLRDAYLEPWGGCALRETFDLAMRVGIFAHVCAWIRQRDALPAASRGTFDRAFTSLLRRAIAQSY